MLYDRSRKVLGTGMVGCIIALFSVNSQVMKGLAGSGAVFVFAWMPLTCRLRGPGGFPTPTSHSPTFSQLSC